MSFKLFVAILFVLWNLLSLVLCHRDDNVLFNFSEILALKIANSSNVQISKILIRRNQTCFSIHGRIIFIYTSVLTYNPLS